ncbi:MAG: hypothetical protein PHE43_01150 [Candidatus Nanoarchaeia archaeon]|nr:hypothetical protein [Candidatus Nanoarchaeia archaeon]
MRITQEHIEELIREVAGPDVIPLVLLLKGKENVSEIKLAEKLNLSVNQVRNMLYRINEFNLVNYTRKKDKKRGWYIYYWTFDDKEAHSLIKAMRRKKLDKLKEKIKTETGQTFFVCTEGCIRMDYANALEHGFLCPECGTNLVQLDNQKYIDSLSEQIRILEEELNTPDPEPIKKVTRKPAKKVIKKPIKKLPKKPVKKKIFKKPIKKQTRKPSKKLKKRK